MPYILPKGTYYDASPYVAAGSIECAVRPLDHVLTNNWQTDPMNASVCWRAKTPAEIRAEEDDAFNEIVESDFVLKALFEELEITNPGITARSRARVDRPR
jgi:hypothetical protein